MSQLCDWSAQYPSIQQVMSQRCLTLVIGTRERQWYSGIHAVWMVSLKSLQKDHSITARQADKSFCVVVMDTSQYIREGLTHLNDEIVYEILSQGQYTKALGIHLNIQYKKWLVEDIITCSRYKKKIKRTSTTLGARGFTSSTRLIKPHPLRDQVSGTKGPTETASQVLDAALKQASPDYHTCSLTRHNLSTQSINAIEQTTAPKDCLLVTIDVKSLYTNIP